MASAHLDLTNGWTIGLSDDTPPAIASVAAWPTKGDTKDMSRWFDFSRPADKEAGIRSYDRRCHSAADIAEAFEAVMSAPRPETAG